jgi:DNA-binding MarR family transcriptional regulator
MRQFKQKNRPGHKAEIANRLHSATIHLLRRLRKQDTASGEGPARLSALSVLVFGGPMTLGQLATAEQVRPPTMSRIVAGLERSGLARRTPDPKDARRAHISPTGKGVHLLQRARKRRIEDLMRQVEMLGNKKLEALRKAVRILEKMLARWQ